MKADYEVHTWFERDRAHVELRNAATQETVLEFWDEEVDEAIEAGFLDFSHGARRMANNLVEYAWELGLVDGKYQNVRVI